MEENLGEAQAQATGIKVSESKKLSFRRLSTKYNSDVMSKEEQGRRQVSLAPERRKEGSGSKQMTYSQLHSESSYNDQALKQAFDRMKNHYDSLHLMTLFNEFTKRGICPNEDERLAPVREELTTIYRGRLLTDIDINFETFKKVTEPVSLLLQKVLNNNMAIQDIDEWEKCLSLYYLAVKHMTGKDIAVSITSADGQRLKWGPTKRMLALNELLHVVAYLMAMDSLGFSCLHQTIGLETRPKSEWIPGNPLVGAGALAVVAQLVTHTMGNKNSTERHETMRKVLFDLTGGCEILFDSKSFVSSERKSEYFKAVLSWMISDNTQELTCKDVNTIVQFYLECSSLQLNTDALSVLGATMANGGICATTGIKIFCSECVEKVLSMMTVSSGKPGVPILASSSGAVLLIVPGVIGVAVHSDDPLAPGYFISALLRHFALNPYERIFLRMGREKGDKCQSDSTLFQTARTGDIMTLSSLLDAGTCLTSKDFMGRTVIHVAAARGHLSYIQFILEFCPQLVAAKDIMGRTGLDEARSFHHLGVATFLQNWEVVSLGPSSGKSSVEVD